MPYQLMLAFEADDVKNPEAWRLLHQHENIITALDKQKDESITWYFYQLTLTEFLHKRNLALIFYLNASRDLWNSTPLQQLFVPMLAKNVKLYILERRSHK